MDHHIGRIAGEVWNYLEENGEASISEVSRNVKESKSKVNMAIGWLAKEDKVNFIDKKRGYAMELK